MQQSWFIRGFDYVLLQECLSIDHKERWQPLGSKVQLIHRNCHLMYKKCYDQLYTLITFVRTNAQFCVERLSRHQVQIHIIDKQTFSTVSFDLCITTAGLNAIQSLVIYKNIQKNSRIHITHFSIISAAYKVSSELHRAFSLESQLLAI